jgi:hypothetical protein
MRLTQTFCGLTAALLALHTAHGEDWCASTNPWQSNASDFGSALALSEFWMAIGDREWPGGGAAVVYPLDGQHLGPPVAVRAPVPVPGAMFGSAIAISDNYLFVSQSGQEGRAFSYRYQNGEWLATGELNPNDGPDFTSWSFGSSMCIGGAQAVVGAKGRGLPHRGGAGAAYLFERSDGVWSRTARFIADDAGAGDEFGSCVGMVDLSVFVGAPFNESENGTDSGAAYVFTSSGAGWNQTQKLVALDGGPFDAFGYSLAVRSGRVVVGAPFAVVNGFAGGAAYVFEWNGSLWVQTATVLPSRASDWAMFGASIAFSGDDILIGSPEIGGGGDPDATGRVYMFSNVGGLWTESAVLVPPSAESDAEMGWAVAADETVAVTARAHDENYVPGHPLLVSVFVRNGTDANGNGISDACECVGDLDGDRVVGLSDLTALLTNFGRTDATPADGDFDGDADVDLSDLTFMLAAFGFACA